MEEKIVIPIDNSSNATKIIPKIEDKESDKIKKNVENNKRFSSKKNEAMPNDLESGVEFFDIPIANREERIKIKSEMMQGMLRPVQNNKKRLCSPDFDLRNLEENRRIIFERTNNRSAERKNNNISRININEENENNSKDPELRNIINRKQNFLDRINNIGKAEESVEQNNKELFKNKNKDDKNKKLSCVFTFKNKKEETNLNNSNNLDSSKDVLQGNKNKFPEKLKDYFKKIKK